MAASVLSVNVGRKREIEWLGRRSLTAAFKDPVAGRVAVEAERLAGDEQGDLRYHGGPDKAVYAYAQEDYEWWETELERPLHPGTFGENLTVGGLDVTCAIVGERWAVGSALLEVTGPRTPCWKIGARMGSADFPVWFAAAGRPGAYFRVVSEGELGAGDALEVVHRPGHRLTVGDVARIYHGDRGRAGELLRAPELAAEWRTWATERAAGAERFLPG